MTFVTRSTAEFDDSHDVHHANSVFLNAVKICMADYPELCLERDKRIITYACYLHDVCDHKYKEQSITEAELHEFIHSQLAPDEAQIVIDIINNVSFSKEVKGKRQSLHQPYLDIVSDADRLEAIGHVGLERCIAFTKAMNKPYPEDVITHCHEKLLRLYNEGFIRTYTGKLMARPLHKVISDYVVENS